MKSRNEMSQLRRRALTSALTFGVVVFGAVFAQGQILTPRAVVAAAPLTPQSGQTMSGVADLAASTSPGVVSIEVVEKPSPQKSKTSTDPMEFFFGDKEKKGEKKDPPKQALPLQALPFRETSSGSGFVISADGWIVTNYHVIRDALKVTVILGKRHFPAVIKGTDPDTDLALLKIEAGAGLKFLPLGDSDALRVGEPVMTIGNPLRLDHTVTVGVVSAKGRSIGISNSSFEDFIQTDAAINFGNSGGPLLNMRGEVIGINTAINYGADNIGFAVPVKILKSVLPQLRERGKVSRGYLGLKVVNLDYETAQSFGLQSPEGALIVADTPDTPGGQAGNVHGDIILAVDNVKVKQTRDLIDYISYKEPGATVTLQILREGARLSSVVTLGARPVTRKQPQTSTPERPRNFAALGVDVRDLTAKLRTDNGIPTDVPGVLVADLSPTSALADREIRPGDVIVEVNGKAVETLARFKEILAELKPGGFLRMYLWRYNPGNPQTKGSSFFSVVRVP